MKAQYKIVTTQNEFEVDKNRKQNHKEATLVIFLNHNTHGCFYLHVGGIVINF